MCERVTGLRANNLYTDRREGDPARLVASYDKVKKELGWEPKYSFEDIIRSAWEWHRWKVK